MSPRALRLARTYKGSQGGASKQRSVIVKCLQQEHRFCAVASHTYHRVVGKSGRSRPMYGPGVPGRLARLTPKGRAEMRRLLQQHLDVLESHDTSDRMREEVRRELRRYGG